MYEIKHINEMDLPLVKEFLSIIPEVEQIDEDVLKNASVLYNDKEVCGLISYEAFFNYALIRYFVFRRNVNEEIVKELFTSLTDNIEKENIEYIFSLVNQEDIFNLFSSLEFKEVDKENVFIEEECYANSRFRDTKLMIKSLI